MKTIIKLTLLLALLLPTLDSAHDIVVNGIYYNINGNEATVTYGGSSYSSYYSEYSGSVVIPATVTYNGTTYPVTSIGDNTFNGCLELTSVTIPNSVTSIGYNAFYRCSRLSSVNISDISAWYNISFENGESNPMYYAGHLYLNGTEITNLTVPSSVTSIGNYAFIGCSELTSVTIPNSVTSIGDAAFNGCSGLTSLTIPNSVTSIGYNAFSGTTWYENQTDGLVYAGLIAYKYKGTMPNNTSIIISDGTVGITAYAFNGCSGLTSVTIPNSVTSIGNGAFEGCSGLTSVTIPNSVTSIGEHAFYNCSGLTSVTIPNSVTSIGDRAFRECSGLTSVTIPNSVTSIGNSAFYGCSGLTSVNIPNSVTSIGNYAFQGCTALSTLYFDADSCADFSSTASNVPFYNLNISTINIGNNVQRIPAYFAYGLTELSKITIPNSVTSIGNAAFYGCSGLTIVNIPNSVTSISNSTFYGCSGLTSINIPNSVTSIGNYAFYNCSGLTSISIPNSVTSIGNYALSYCSGLASIDIPNSITSIGIYLFNNCSGLTSITIPNTVTSIGHFAFSYCRGLKSVIIPNSVTSIGNYTFQGCSGLTSIDIPNSVTSIGNSAFKGCSALSTLNYNAGTCADFSSTATERPFNNLNITTINIGNDVQRIPAYFAYGLTKLSNISVSGSVTSVGSSAFYNCTELTKVSISDIAAWCNINFGNLSANPLYYAQHLYLNDDEITNLVVPDGVETIGSYAFYNGIFSTVRIAKTVTYVGKQAFNNSPSIETVTCAAVIPPSWDDIAMFTTNVYNHSPLYVPLGSERSYMSDQCWGQFSTIVGIEIQDVILATGISLSQSQMSLQAGGTSQLIATVLPDSTSNKAVTWISSAPDIATVDTTGLVTAIAPGSATITATTTDGSYLSASCTITVADSTIITFADDDVKALCVQNWDTNGDGELNTDEAAAVTNLGDIFSDTDITSFNELAYFTGLTSIGYGTFRDCYNLISITIPAGVTSIGDEAFSGCSSLTSITIPENVTSIGTAAFYGCSGLSSITIPAGVTSINDGTFSHCSNLSSITIPASVTSIGYEAFYHCISLMSISIPASVTSIDYEAFYGCSELNTVTCLASTPPTIYSNTFTTYGTLYVPAGKKSHIKVRSIGVNSTISLSSQPLPHLSH